MVGEVDLGDCFAHHRRPHTGAFQLLRHGALSHNVVHIFPTHLMHIAVYYLDCRYKRIVCMVEASGDVHTYLARKL